MLRKLLFGPPNADKTCKKIYWLYSKSAFRLFREKDFRVWLEFDELTQQEQDRIFNELMVTAGCLSVLMTETLIKFHEDDFKDFLKQVAGKLTTIHQETIRSLGVEDHLVKMWDDLLNIRKNEYMQDYNQYRSELPNVEEDNPWILVTAVGGFDHITRGKGKPTDLVYRMILKWLGKLSFEINGIFISDLKRTD